MTFLLTVMVRPQSKSWHLEWKLWVMLLFLVLFSTNIHRSQSEPCSKRTLYQICSAPSDCPTQYRALRDTCSQKYAQRQVKESSPDPTPEIITSTLSSGVITFPSVTNRDQNYITEVCTGILVDAVKAKILFLTRKLRIMSWYPSNVRIRYSSKIHYHHLCVMRMRILIFSFTPNHLIQ